MRKMLAITLPLFAILVLSACKKEGVEPVEESNYVELAKVDIMDAQSLYILESPEAKASSKTRILYKIKVDGSSQQVSFLDKLNKKIIANVFLVLELSPELIFVSGYFTLDVDKDPNMAYPSDFNQQKFDYLVRVKDGAVYDLREYSSSIIRNLNVYPSTLLLDQSGAIYWRHWTDSSGNKLFKMSVPEIGDITASSISGEIEAVGLCYIDNQDVILMGVIAGSIQDWLCRFPDGTFVKCDGIRYDAFGSNFKGALIFPLKDKDERGFMMLSNELSKTRVLRITPNTETKQVNIQSSLINVNINDFSIREDMEDGRYVFSSFDYKKYLYVNPKGDMEIKNYDEGFSYDKRVSGRNCVYGVGGSTIYKMDFTNRKVTQLFSNNNYGIDRYQVAPDESYVEIFGIRYSDARKVLLRVNASGQIIKETLQTDNNAEVIKFIRLR